MYRRHEEVPVFERRRGQLSARHFNQVQVALNRIGPCLRLKLPRLRHLDLILQRDAWIVVDRSINDLPIAAWTEFENAGRGNLHQPINCSIRLFHINGGVVLKRALEEMEVLLGKQLEKGDSGPRIIPFRSCGTDSGGGGKA